MCLCAQRIDCFAGARCWHMACYISTARGQTAARASRNERSDSLSRCTEARHRAPCHGPRALCKKRGFLLNARHLAAGTSMCPGGTRQCADQIRAPAFPVRVEPVENDLFKQQRIRLTRNARSETRGRKTSRWRKPTTHEATSTDRSRTSPIQSMGRQPDAGRLCVALYGGACAPFVISRRQHGARADRVPGL